MVCNEETTDAAILDVDGLVVPLKLELITGTWKKKKEKKKAVLTHASR